MNDNTMKTTTPRPCLCLLRAMIAASSMLLVSCAIPDPLFLQQASQIRDTPYPASKVSGDWMTVTYSPIQTTTEDAEYKFYVRFLPGGRAEFRQFAFNQRGNQEVEMRAPATWQYQGNNVWMLNIPGSEQFVVDRNRQANVLPFPPSTIRLRYHEGRLFDFTRQAVWVRLNSGELSRMKQRLKPVKQDRQLKF